MPPLRSPIATATRPVPPGAPAVVRSTTTAHGLTVVSQQLPHVRSVALGAWVRTGTLHEPVGQMGVAHLLEHMVFKGTRRRTAREIAASLEHLGGSLDAYTEREFTSYQARVIGRDLPVAADVLGDLVFEPALRDSDLALERQVILEEIAMVEDTPDDLVFDLHNEALWGAHPHGARILGTRETVTALDVPALRALHGSAYVPGRLVVAAVGAVEHERLLETLADAGWLDRPAGGAPVPDVAAPTPARGGRVHHPRRDSAQVHVVLGGDGPRYGHPDRFAFAALELVIGGGMSSRLFQRVREELGYAYSVQTWHTPFADTGHHGLYLASAPRTAQAALDAAREVLADVAAHGLTDAELVEAKRQLRGQVELAEDSISARLGRLANATLYGEPWRDLDALLADIDAVDATTVRSLAAAYYDPDRLTLVSLGPTAVR